MVLGFELNIQIFFKCFLFRQSESTFRLLRNDLYLTLESDFQFRLVTFLQYCSIIRKFYRSTTFFTCDMFLFSKTLFVSKQHYSKSCFLQFKWIFWWTFSLLLLLHAHRTQHLWLQANYISVWLWVIMSVFLISRNTGVWTEIWKKPSYDFKTTSESPSAFSWNQSCVKTCVQTLFKLFHKHHRSVRAASSCL